MPRRAFPRAAALAALFLCAELLPLFADSPAAGRASTLVVLDSKKIYYGKANKAKKPAVVKLKKVYKHIPAYRRIVEEGLKKTEARYHLLMAQASKAFRKALSKVAKEKGYDLIAEFGAIKVKDKKLQDITKLAIKKIKGTP